MYNYVNRVLEADAARNIYTSALKVLNEIGVKCDHKKAIDVLEQKGKIDHRNGRIHFDIDELDACFSNRKKEIEMRNRLSAGDAAKNEFRMGGHWNCLELCDPVANMPRPASYDESVRMAKLGESLGAKNVPIPVSPGDINPRMRTLVSEKIALVHTRTLGSWLTATDRNEIRIICEMHKAAGRKYTLGLEGLITPLKFNPEVFDTYFDWCDDPDVNIGIMAGIPVAGSTAPLVFPGGLVVALAEALALDYVSLTLSDGKWGCMDMRLEIFDMMDANLAYGTPEWCLLMQAIGDLWEGLTGSRPVHGAFRTNGKVVDGQTLIERTASFMFQAFMGKKAFGSVGQLCMDEVYSPVQAILDREIVRYGKRLFSGIGGNCWDNSLDMIRLIEEGIADDGFMIHDTTINIFRDFFNFERLTSAINLTAWKNKGGLTMEARAWEEARELISAHDFELEDSKRNDVEKLYRQGEKYLL